MNINLRNAYSFRGLGQRANQEDSRYPDSDTADVSATRCFLVCDGVGGAAKGEVASSTAASAIGSFVDSLGKDTPFTNDRLSQALDVGYSALDRVADPSNSGMGTTMTMVVFHDGGVNAAHIGDSRIYHIRPHQGILYRSEDHSLVNALVRTGNITPEEAINHPRSNVITRCMSAAVDHQRDSATNVLITDVLPGDVFILCSDGVLHCVSDDDLCRVVDMDIPEEGKCKILSEMSADSNDNNTLWMITVGSVGDSTDTAAEEEAAPFEEQDSTRTLTNPMAGAGEVNARAPQPRQPRSLIDRITSFFKR